MNFGSVCSGIEAASVAWESLGWKAEWFAEVEPAPASVLAHHWPEVPNLGDMTKVASMIKRCEISAPEILVGGTPCQAFSVAGSRNSLEDDRGKLSLSFIELADQIDATRKSNGLAQSIVVWENVPGVLSTKDNAFGYFLGKLAGENRELFAPRGKWGNAGCIFGPKRAIAWRVFNAEYFGVAQRRKRVFLVASAREGFYPHEILFEFEGMRRDFAPSREKKEDVAGTLTSRTTDGFPGGEEALSGCQVVGTLDAVSGRRRGSGIAPEQLVYQNTSHCLTAKTAQRIDFETESFVVQAFAENSRAEVRLENGDGQVSGCLSGGGGKAGQGMPCVVHGSQDPIISENKAHSLGRNSGQENILFENSRVRRLMPVECERLQGFPDNHTLSPYRGKPMKDGPRYKAIGNSMAVPCMRWIGKRIQNHCGKN